MGTKLRPYQIEPADRLEAMLRAGSAGDLSDCGTGKTYMACEMLRRLDEPTLVVCPFISQTAWRQVGEFIGTEFDVINYDKLRTGDTPYLKREIFSYRWANVKGVRTRVPVYRYVWAKEIKRLVFDECFPPETMVLTTTGASPIFRLEPGDTVLTDVGPRKILRKIANTSPDGYRLLEITHQYGKLRCTPNHKLWTQRGWVRAEELCPLRDSLFDSNLPTSGILHPGVRRCGTLDGCEAGGGLQADAGTGPETRAVPGCRPVTDDHQQPGQGPDDTGEELGCAAGETIPHNPGREWEGSNGAAGGPPDAPRRGVGSGERADGFCEGGPVAGGAPIRRSEPPAPGGRRMRRELPQNTEGAGPGREEGRIGRESGMGDFTVQEHRSDAEPRTDSLRNSQVLRVKEVLEFCPVVFDLEVEGAHRYFADGILVSNCHRCSAMDSLQSKMLSAAVAQEKNPLLITGSVAESPLQLKAIGYAFGLHQNQNFWHWAQQHGCWKAPFGGLKFTDNEERAAGIMQGLHAQIFPEKAIRIRVTDMGDFYKGFLLQCPLIDVPKASEVDKLSSDIVDALDALETRIAERGASEEHPMTKLLRARQRLDLLKLPARMALGDELYEQNHTVLFFENFSECVARLAEKYPDAGVVTGDTPKEERDRIMHLVQTDQMRRVILNSAAGGESISLHNVTGRHPRASLLSHQYSAKLFRQIVFRTARSGAADRALVLLPVVAGTVEETIKKRVEKKSLCLDSLNDGDILARV